MPATLPEPEASEETATGDDGARLDHPLDASAHAHLLEEPLPPDAATETAVIYNVTLAGPHLTDDATSATREDRRTVPVQRRSALGQVEVADAEPDERTSERTDERTGGTASTSAPDDPAVDAHRAEAEPARAPRPPVRTGERAPTSRRIGAAAAVVLVGALASLSGYLWISATEWRDHAGLYQRTASDLGEELSGTRNDLAGSQAELEAVRAQLSTAHERIVELADEKNQALDDWELTQQLVDYQQRISVAAGTVALALDQCVQGQQELIGYLQEQVDPQSTAPPYDPAVLVEFETQVEALCQEASEANIGLQLELAR